MSDNHDTVVVERGGSGLGVIVGIVVIALLLVGFWYFALGPGKSGTSQPTDINVNIEVPSVAPQGS